MSSMHKICVDIHVTYKVCVNRLFMLFVRLLVNSRLLVVKFWGSQKLYLGTSLVAQWLRIHLPMQGTRVRAVVREVPTCRGETKPVWHNY